MTATTLWQRLLTITTDDDDIRRRGRHLAQIALMLIVVTLLLLVSGLISHGPNLTDAILVVVEIFYIGILSLARRGWVTLGGVLLTAVLIPPILNSLRENSLNSVVSLYLALPLLAAGLVLPPRTIGLVLTALAVGGVAAERAAAPNVITAALAGLAVVGLLAFMGASSVRTALAQASATRERAEQAADALVRANAGLERQVQERTEKLQLLLAEAEQRSATQARLLEEIAAQRLTIRDLEVPVLPVSQHALVMPLVGALDDARLEIVRSRALETIKTQHARWLLLDITGVPVVDKAVARGLLTVVRAARLLGSDVMLIGVRPEVAQTLVGLGLDMSHLHAMRDLQTSLQRLIA